MLVGVHPAATYPAAGSALLSLQSYSSTTALSPTRHEERRMVSTLCISHSGRPLATTLERAYVARHPGGYCSAATTVRCPHACGASKNLLGTSSLAFAKTRAKMAGGPASSTYFYSDLLADHRLESMESHLGILAVAKIVEGHGLTAGWGIAVMLW